jgi:hypothetical protein
MSYKAADDWCAIAKINFASLSTGGPYNDGSNVIGGVTWSMENCTSGTAGQIQVSNGNGLQLSSASGATNLIDATRTSALMKTSFINLASTFDWSKYKKVRASIIASSGDMNANKKGLVFGIARYSGNVNDDARMECDVIYNSGVKYFGRSNYNGTTLTTNGQSNNPQDVLQVTCDLTCWNLGQATTNSSVSGDFPTDNSTAVLRGTFSPTSGSVLEPFVSMDDLGVILSPINEIGGIYTVTITKLLIEVA